MFTTTVAQLLFYLFFWLEILTSNIKALFFFTTSICSLRLTVFCPYELLNSEHDYGNENVPVHVIRANLTVPLRRRMHRSDRSVSVALCEYQMPSNHTNFPLPTASETICDKSQRPVLHSRLCLHSGNCPGEHSVSSLNEVCKIHPK